MDDKDDNADQTVLKPIRVTIQTTVTDEEQDEGLLSRIKRLKKLDVGVMEALEELRKEGPRQLTKALDEWTTDDGLILYRGKVYVPDDDDIRRELVRTHHDTRSAGHPGRWKTYELLSRGYWWPGMSTYVEKYVGGCEVCLHSKNFPKRPLGLLKPNEVPDRAWGVVTCDFIVALPES